MIYVVVSLVVIAALYFGKDKLGFRLRGAARKIKNSAADKIGNVSDDFKQRIHETKENNEELEKQLVNLKVEINSLERKYEHSTKSALELADQAKLALTHNNESAAREAIQTKQEQEKLAKIYLTSLQQSEKTYNNLLEQLRSRKLEVQSAESSRVVFEATHKSLEITKKAKESAKLFGGAGNLDISSSSEELARLQDELNALDDIDNSELKKFNSSLQNKSIDEELKKLKEIK